MDEKTVKAIELGQIIYTNTINSLQTKIAELELELQQVNEVKRIANDIKIRGNARGFLVPEDARDLLDAISKIGK